MRVRVAGVGKALLEAAETWGMDARACLTAHTCGGRQGVSCDHDELGADALGAVEGGRARGRQEQRD
jgi:hypothetical protein